MKTVKPSIILVRPQLPENIGMVARAMDNCGLKNLIIVSPREIWPNKIALQSAANSKLIITKAQVYNSLNAALSKFNYVIATSKRKRFLQKPLKTDFHDLFESIPQTKNTAIVFGPENSGLSNEDLMLADIIFNIDLSKTNTSLNLSHAVLILSYKWREFFMLHNIKPKYNSLSNNLALKSDFLNFMDFLKNELNDVGFFYPQKKTKSMFENIQTMFMRTSLSKTEIQTLWGMIKKLRKQA